MKKFLSVILASLMLLLACTNVSAAVPDVVLPLWDNTTDISHVITFVGTSGNVTADVTAKSGTTKITGYVIVYKEVDDSWVYVTSESAASIDQWFTLSLDFEGETGGYYRSYLSVSVTRNGVKETITDDAYVKC